MPLSSLTLRVGVPLTLTRSVSEERFKDREGNVLFLARFFILFGLIWLLVRTEKPFLCSGIYTGAHVLFSFLLEVPFTVMLFHGMIALALSSLYFWLLSRIQMGHAIWWVVLCGGIVIGMV